ncbi:hypothetical protein BHM03_00062515 [Ensete ventricosum]|nr:hypothetical protein BHM03_00062515 [Ensete ventricosum]
MPENPSPGPQLGTLFEKRISHFHLSRCRILEFRYLLGVKGDLSLNPVSIPDHTFTFDSLADSRSTTVGSELQYFPFRLLLTLWSGKVVCSIKMISLNCCDAASGVQHLNICIWSVA